MKPSHEDRARRNKSLLMALDKGASTGDVANAAMIDKPEVGRYMKRFERRTGINIRRTCEDRKMSYSLDMPLEEAIRLCYNADAKSFSWLAQQERRAEPKGNPVDAPRPRAKRKERVKERETPWWGLITVPAPINCQIGSERCDR